MKSSFLLIFFLSIVFLKVDHNLTAIVNMIINEMSLLSNQVSNVPGTVRPQEVLVDGATESWWSPSVESKSILHSKTACSELTSFPFRLHDMLNDAEGKGFADVICWQGDGRSFKIRDKCRFAKEVLPNYFQGQTHYKSFQRQRKFVAF